MLTTSITCINTTIFTDRINLIAIAVL